MHVSYQESQPTKTRGLKNLSYALIPPIIGLALVTIIMAATVGVYRAQYKNKVYTGVSVWNTNLSGMTAEEARAALNNLSAYPDTATISLINPVAGDAYPFTPAELGIRLDADQTVAAALEVGRSGSPLQQLQDTFQSWYSGRRIAPIMVFDESRMDQAIAGLAAEIERSAINSTWQLNENNAPSYSPPQIGRELDRTYLRQQLLTPVTNLADAEIELLVHDVIPVVYDPPDKAARLERLLSEPIRFYLLNPLEEDDLNEIVLPTEELARWIGIEQVEDADGRINYAVTVDENKVRNWLSQFSAQVKRSPVNARYYFDDLTGELVLVSPHVTGREMDIEATATQFTSRIKNYEHSVPIIVNEIQPLAHSKATAEELGITELIAESTTWFSGSSDARKDNIYRAATNFYGIVIAPGEEFSFNRYLGSISEADGYKVGLIIFGGRTIKGVGGGVCQVSTTLFQTAFWAGFPITERWEHGYQVEYYNDGEGPGMDATVYSPLVDLRFINNTPHHLLIENYYNPEFESLTFKFYSTSMGRTIEKSGPVFENITPAPEEDVWEFDEDITPGTAEQYDYAAEGARVTIERRVFNANGELLDDRAFISNYIPWPNVYRYGPGVEPGDYSAVINPDS